MSLEQLSFLSQILPAFAVVASLVFVGIQLRHALPVVDGGTMYELKDAGLRS